MSVVSLEHAIGPGASILLDTTVIIAYFKGSETAFPVSRHIIDQFVALGRNQAVVSTVTAHELLVEPIRLKDDHLYRSVLFFLLHTRNLRILPIDFREAHEAALLRAHLGFRSPDALIIATGRVAPVDQLVTNDGEWHRKLSGSANEPAVCYLEDHLPFP